MLYVRKPGFSLIEMLLVLGIIAFLSSMIIPRIMQFSGRKDEAVTKLTLSKLQEGIALYQMDIGHAPTNKEGKLRALISRPGGEAGDKWRGNYLTEKELPKDAWNNDFEYSAPPSKFKKNFKSYEMYSYGDPRGEDRSHDLKVGA